MAGAKMDAARQGKASPTRMLAGILLLAAWVAPASAAPEPDYSAAETRKMMYNFGLCMAEHDRAKASQIVLSIAEEVELIPILRSMRGPECLREAARQSVTMNFPGDMIRYAMADALFAVDLRGLTSQNFAAVPRLRHREVDESKYRPKPGKKTAKRQLEDMERRRMQALAYAYFSRFGECVVRADAGNAHALLMTQPATVEEARGFAALAPAFGNCLVAGKQFAANRMVMRGSIAINYYRLATAARNAAGGVSGDA